MSGDEKRRQDRLRKANEKRARKRARRGRGPVPIARMPTRQLTRLAVEQLQAKPETVGAIHRALGELDQATLREFAGLSPLERAERIRHLALAGRPKAEGLDQEKAKE